MCIGNLRSGTENLHHYLHTKERKFLDSSLLYYGIIICFIIGAVIGNAVVRILHEKAILGCSFLLFVAFLIMFIDREKELRETLFPDKAFLWGPRELAFLPGQNPGILVFFTNTGIPGFFNADDRT